MDIKELEKYFIPACMDLGLKQAAGWVSVADAEKLDELLGEKLYATYTIHSIKPLAGRSKKLLRALAGPHGKTILKMYRIQKGLEK